VAHTCGDVFSSRGTRLKPLVALSGVPLSWPRSLSITVRILTNQMERLACELSISGKQISLSAIAITDHDTFVDTRGTSWQFDLLRGIELCSRSLNLAIDDVNGMSIINRVFSTSGAPLSDFQRLAR